jgi:ABC-type spermidine/putrescine transport system permease subunit II
MEEPRKRNPSWAGDLDFYDIGLKVLSWAIFLFVLAPIIIVIIISFTSKEMISFPPKGFSLRWYQAFFTEPPWVENFKNSTVIAFYSTLLSTFIGTLAALSLRGKTKDFPKVNTMILLPMMIPGVILGISLLMYTGKIGLYGTVWPVVLAHSLWGTPYVYMIVSSILQGIDPSLEDAARNLGAGPVKTFFLVTAPLIKTGIFVGALFAFISSFGEFIMALFLTTGKTTTLPVQIFTSLKYDISPVVAAVSTFFIVLTILIVGLSVALTGLKTLRGQ